MEGVHNFDLKNTEAILIGCLQSLKCSTYLPYL